MALHQDAEKNGNNLQFPGKIVIVTCTASVSDEEFRFAEYLKAKYGAGKIIHAVWPENFITDHEQMIDLFAALADDCEIKALVLVNVVPGTNAAVDKFLESRNNVFIIYCSPQEAVSSVAIRANLILGINNLDMSRAMVHQAKKQGAKVFVHYSFQRHMSEKILSGRRDRIRDACRADSIEFVDATVPDPTGEAGITGASEFIIEDVPKLTAKYGEDTAFFCSNCLLQVPLIKAVVSCHAIYPQPCCPSPFHGFPKALGIDTGGDPSNLKQTVSEISRIAAEKKMTGRLSAWPISACMIFMSVGTEYAIRWLRGEAPRNGIDIRVLKDCMNTYIEEVAGQESSIFFNSYSEDGVTYENFKLIIMSYLDF